MADALRVDVDPAREIPTLTVPEIRDYQKINAELAVLLDAGHPVVRLAGVGGQRLLVSGLAGDWDAVVEVEGRPGPEFGAGLDAPRLKVVSLGPVADGVGSRLKQGALVILGHAGSGAGYAQAGGLLLIAGDAGPRAGLNQRGGTLLIGGQVGRLAGERQAGGSFLADALKLGPHVGRGRIRGEALLLGLDETNPITPPLAEARMRLREIAERGGSLTTNPEFSALLRRFAPS